jgi:hypothetical protein
MDLYFFSSKSITNIWAGVGARLWAVSKVDDAQMKSRVTKSARLHIGSAGIIYCSAPDIQAFTTPFIVFSKPDPTIVVRDVWPEEWVLPFRILPLGSPRRLFPLTRAHAVLPVLRDSSRGNIAHELPITGTTVFVPKQVTHQDWEVLLTELAE